MQAITTIGLDCHPLRQDPRHRASALAHGFVRPAPDEGRRHRACQQDCNDTFAEVVGFKGERHTFVSFPAPFRCPTFTYVQLSR
jgi:hypothetical protein